MAQRPTTEPIRVLIVEDSPAQAELLVALLQSDGFVIVGAVSDGRQAVGATARLRPDVVLMDIHLPGQNGYSATQQIMQQCPTPIVLISGITGDVAQRTVEALAVGALAVVRKPAGPHHPHAMRDRDALCTTVRLMAGVPVVTRFSQRGYHPAKQHDSPQPAGAAPQWSLQPIPTVPIRLLAMAASTGGPQTIARVLCDLGPDFPLPIVIVQHIAAGFAAPLAEWLTRMIVLPVQIAQQHATLLPGHVYLAPDSAHLTVDMQRRVALKGPSADERFCPSADRLFASVAATYGRSAIGVILTGMGDDGARGLHTLRMAGGLTLAQDVASCVVAGMPVAALERGAVERVVPLAALAAVVREHMSAHQSAETR